MVSILLCWKFGAGLAGDPVAKDGLLSLELSRLVFGVNPVQDVLLAF